MEITENNGCYYEIEKFENDENMEAIIDHFVNTHGYYFTKNRKFQLKLSLICSFETYYGDYIWTPVVIKLEEARCYVLVQPVVKNKMLGWLTLFLPFANNDVNKINFHLEFNLCRDDSTISSEISFTQTPFSVDKLDICVLYSLPYRLCLSILEPFAINSNGDLLFNCRIKPIQAPLTKNFGITPSLERLTCSRTRNESWGWFAPCRNLLIGRDKLRFLRFPPTSLFLLILWIQLSPDPLAEFLRVQFPVNIKQCRPVFSFPFPLSMRMPLCLPEDD